MDAEAELKLLDGDLGEFQRLLGGEGAQPGPVCDFLDAGRAKRPLGFGQLLGDSGLPLDEPLADDVPDEVGGALAGLVG